MEFTITKEQVKEIYQNYLRNQDYLASKSLKEWFPEAFKTELEIGKWYKSNDYPKHIFFVTEIKNNRYYYYGFQVDGKYESQEWYSFNDAGLQEGFELATTEEVEAALIAEAKRRGYKIGASTKSGKIINGYKEWSLEGDWFYHHNIAIFDSGKWAEIIPTEKTVISREKALKILAKKLKASPENIEIK